MNRILCLLYTHLSASAATSILQLFIHTFPLLLLPYPIIISHSFVCDKIYMHWDAQTHMLIKTEYFYLLRKFPSSPFHSLWPREATTVFLIEL